MTNFFRRELITGGTLESRNKRREKVAELWFDLGKFVITGVVFAGVLKAAEGGINLEWPLFAFAVLGLAGGLLICWLGIKELSRLEVETLEETQD